MTMPSSRFFARSVLSLAIAALAGCAAPELNRPAEPPAGATTAPAGAIANFSAGLRCMDNLLLEYGTRELPVMVEDLADPNRKLDAGMKDVLSSAVSDMSRRSRVLRLVADGAGADKALSSFHALRPEYALRGSISQADDKTLAVDLRMLATQDLTLVPGVASRNQAALSKRGGEIIKFGHSFSLWAGGTQDGPAQARRALVELGAIELIGRLAKLPYWSCLGGADDDPDVAAEIRDWYDAMAARPKEIIQYFQEQMRLRGVYDGPVDGVANPQFKEAVARYREVLGLSREPKLSKDFLKAYLAANHRELLARVMPVVSAASQPPAPVAPQRPALAARPAPLALRVASANQARQFDRGEAIQLVVRPSRDAHVYCFLEDENRQITRFFPNRFQRASRVDASAGVQLPGAMRFEIRMNGKGVKETVSCFATERDVLAELPASLNAPDFAPLPVASLEQVRSAFSQAAGGALAHESFQVRPR